MCVSVSFLSYERKTVVTVIHKMRPYQSRLDFEPWVGVGGGLFVDWPPTASGKAAF